MYNVTPNSGLVTTAAAEEQEELHILDVCL